MKGTGKKRKPLHVGIGHFTIGTRDGVNIVISRNVEGLLDLQPETKITLFGKLEGNLSEFAESIAGKVDYINIDEFDPAYEVPGLARKTISDQKIQDYIWQGINIMEVLAEKLKPFDIVLTENLGIGINPAVTYAFFLYLQYCQHHHPRKRIFYRAHDFLQQRAKNFQNLKKFQDTELALIPNWHEVIYPNYPNMGYITINTFDVSRLIEHGVDRTRIAYVPNCIDEGLIVPDDEHKNLRKRLNEELGLAPHVKIILYPVRCVKRKNVEEAVFLTCLFNAIAQKKIKMHGVSLKDKFHLLVGVKPTAGEDKEYADTIGAFCKRHKLPVTVGLQDFVSFEREVNPKRMEIVKFGLGDAFKMADIVVTTSYLEGFGFAFIEPWYIGKAVIGRNIPNVTQDFQRAGVNLDHLYNVLRINGQDFFSIGYQDKEHIGLNRRLKEILKLKDTSYVKKVIEVNEDSIGMMLSFLEPEIKETTIKRNRDVVASRYSKRQVAEQLWEVLTGMQLRLTR
jgi:glycosyltransferase involved in cell wall biosynthesis